MGCIWKTIRHKVAVRVEIGLMEMEVKGLVLDLEDLGLVLVFRGEIFYKYCVRRRVEVGIGIIIWEQVL